MNRNLDYKKLLNDLVDFTYNYVSTYNIKNFILGISGGIDSTVVAAILYETICKYKDANLELLGYSLPTKTTNKFELFVSRLVGYAFCKNKNDNRKLFVVDNIDDITNVIGNRICEPDNANPFRWGNIKSRFRMIYLYDQAKKHNGIVVGTDNYTEKLLGFSTIGGDALADYMPIQFLWKTEVYGLANYLLEKYKEESNWAAVHALSESINLAPQDGLGISTSDMEQIGAKNYFDVDDILFSFENMCVSYDTFKMSKEYGELCNKFTKDVVDKVVQRRVNNFKLNLPVEFKL